MEHGVGVWCGSMLDAGVAKAHNITAATLPNFIYPNDIPPTCKNFLEDYTKPEVVLKPGSVVDVPMGPGIGFDIKTETPEAWTSEKLVFDRGDLK